MQRLITLFVLLVVFFESFAQGNWKRVHGDVISAVPTNGTFALGNSPLGRYSSSGVKDENGNFWLFAGEAQSDLWKFDPTINQWMLVNGSFTANGLAPTYGTQGVAAATNHPGQATYGHPMWSDFNGNLWLFGPNGLNNMWKYSIATNMWTWMKGNSTPGPPVYGIQGVESPTVNPGTCNETDCHWTDSNGMLWLYTEFDGNLWKFNPTTNNWTWMKGNGSTTINPTYGTINVFGLNNTPGGFSACPAVGVLYTMWITSDDHLWMLVNRNLGTLQTEMWEYNPTVNQWRCRRIDQSDFGQAQVYPQSCVENDPTIHPVTRSEMRADWVDNCDNMYFFGGGNFCTMSPVYNDIWRYNPTTNCFTYLKGSTTNEVPGTQGVFSNANIPPVSAGAQSWSNDKGFYLFGGQGALTESDAMWVFQPDSVDADFSYSATCLTVDFTNNSTTGCNSFKSIFWDFGDGNTSTVNSPSHTYLSNGNYQVKLIVENCSSHIDTLIQTVTVDCGFSISLLSDTICSSTCFDLIVNSTSNLDSVTFVWDNGITNSNDTISVCPNATTTYSVIATNSIGESDTAFCTITVLNPPVLDLGSDTVICGDNFQLFADLGFSSYLWQDNSTLSTYFVTSSGLYFVTANFANCFDVDSINVTLVSPLLDLGADTTLCNPNLVLDAGNNSVSYLWNNGTTNQQLAISNFGTYWVTTADSNGCTASDTINISLDVLPLNLGSDQLICSEDSLLLDIGTSWETISWSTGDSLSSIVVKNSGVYSVVASIGQCVSQDSIEITENVLSLSYAINDTIGCNPLLTDFTAFVNSSIPITSWYWDFGDGEFSNEQQAVHAYQASGDYLIQLEVIDSLGCQLEIASTHHIEVLVEPTASFVFNPNLPEVNTEVEFLNLSTNDVQWMWNFGDGTSSNQENPTHVFTTSNEFEIELIAINGICVDTTSIVLTIDEDFIIYVPNSFTPDGDEFNNSFQPIISYNGTFDYELLIFDRWGEIVFESKNPNESWDGTYKKCKLVQDGVYVWKITITGNKKLNKELRGHVTVLK
jgi:gliding motility-associated-like protein